jgi:hypothetical protein
MSRYIPNLSVLSLLIVCLTVLISGCVSVQVASDHDNALAQKISASPENALVYIYRAPGAYGASTLLSVYLDDKKLGELTTGSYVVAELSPGRHTIKSQSEWWTSQAVTTVIDAVPGQSYFFHQLLDMGWAIGSQLLATPEEQARKTLTDSRLIRFYPIAASSRPSLADSGSARRQAAPPPSKTAVLPKANIATPDILLTIPTGKPAGRYDVAVIIGNANYSASGTPNVDFALQDAQLVQQYLIKAFGYDTSNIIYIENATLAKMSELFGTSDDYQGKLYKWVKPGQSKVFIYYVGHGAPDQQSGEGYFVPVDANPQYIRTSGYKLSTFYENLSRIPAIKKTVVIDACFSGSSANGQLLKGVSGLTARLKSEPKASVAADLLLTSAGMDQVSSWYPEKGHSLFTYFFLKGIQGEADSNKDGRITMGEMKAWLNDQVPYMARRLTGNEQQPVMIGKDDDEITVLVR